MYGLRGPDGAGKSSLMRTLATLQEPDSCTATLGDIDVLKQGDELRKRLGYLLQEFGVYPSQSGIDSLVNAEATSGRTNEIGLIPHGSARPCSVGFW
jgi:ABC-type multidrug transport system ATPase subunit